MYRFYLNMDVLTKIIKSSFVGIETWIEIRATHGYT